MRATEPFPRKERTTRKKHQSSQLMREAGEDFLAEALSQAYQDLDEAESSVEQLEDTVKTLEEECERLAEDRQDMLVRIAELSAQVAALQADRQPAPSAPVVPAAPFAPVVVPVAPVAPAPVAHVAPLVVHHAPVAPVAHVAQPELPRRPRVSLRATLDRVSQWMWDEPPDELDEHIARSLRSRWRAGFVLAGLVALIGLAGAAVAVGIPEVQNNLESKTAAIETPAHYSTTPLLQQQER